MQDLCLDKIHEERFFDIILDIPSHLSGLLALGQMLWVSWMFFFNSIPSCLLNTITYKPNLYRNVMNTFWHPQHSLKISPKIFNPLFLPNFFLLQIFLWSCLNFLTTFFRSLYGTPLIVFRTEQNKLIFKWGKWKLFCSPIFNFSIKY